jgi:hypothetical protein
LRGQLPSGVDGVIEFLQRTHGATAAEAYLRHTIGLATRDLFIGMGVAAIAIIGVLATVVPRKFPTPPQ